MWAVRVLLLEDHEGSRFVTRYALRSLGHDCMAVGDVPTALRLTSSFAPDVVIYEWSTRNEQRFGLGARFRESAQARSLVLIALSAADEPPGFRQRERIDGYLTKPFRPGDLVPLLRPRSH
jgi:CheY-like chemotaxis protein